MMSCASLRSVFLFQFQLFIDLFFVPFDVYLKTTVVKHLLITDNENNSLSTNDEKQTTLGIETRKSTDNDLLLGFMKIIINDESSQLECFECLVLVFQLQIIQN